MVVVWTMAVDACEAQNISIDRNFIFGKERGGNSKAGGVNGLGNLHFEC